MAVRLVSLINIVVAISPPLSLSVRALACTINWQTYREILEMGISVEFAVCEMRIEKIKRTEHNGRVDNPNGDNWKR